MVVAPFLIPLTVPAAVTVATFVLSETILYKRFNFAFFMPKAFGLEKVLFTLTFFETVITSFV